MRRIVIAEDNAELRMVMSKILEGSGYDVRQARNGKECLSAVQTRQPDLVITDLLMPETEGLELIMELRRSFPLIRIIAMSGASNVRFLRVALTFGATRTLTKPFAMDDMLAAVSDLTELAG